MIILHNSLDQDSRDFVTAHGAGATVYDWYKGGREAFWAAGHTDKVSAFPSVIVDIPSHRIPPETGPPPTPGRLAPWQQIALRKPRDMADVQKFLDRINVGLAKSAGEGMPVAPLTLGNMSDVKT